MRERLGIIGIVAFVALDVVLVFLAVRHTQATPPESNIDRTVAQTQGAESPNRQDEESPDGESGPSEDPTEPGSDSDEPTYMSVASDASYIRATRGSCEQATAPTVETSTDQGRTFQQANVSNLTEVLRVQANGADDLWLVGTNRNCEMGLYATQDGGETWRRSRGSAGAWHLVRDRSRSQIHAPSGVLDTPCVPISLSTIDAGVLRILCEAGQIVGTSDEGASWVTLGRLDGAVAIRFTSPGDGYAVAARGGCAAAVMETADGGSSWEELTCLGKGQPRSVAAEGDIRAALVDGDLHVSSDNGSTWEVR